MIETLADELKRLCCAETEGKFFDCVTDNIDAILSALRSHDAMVKALEKIAAMDPKGIRADDLGRAARIAATGIRDGVGTSRGPHE